MRELENHIIVKKNKEYKITGKVVEVNDLSFISDRVHRYGWFRRHYKHHRLRRALRRADHVIAGSPKLAVDVVRYYFVPKDKITVR